MRKFKNLAAGLGVMGLVSGFLGLSTMAQPANAAAPVEISQTQPTWKIVNDDGNGKLDPGETAEITSTFTNNGTEAVGMGIPFESMYQNNGLAQGKVTGLSCTKGQEQEYPLVPLGSDTYEPRPTTDQARFWLANDVQPGETITCTGSIMGETTITQPTLTAAMVVAPWAPDGSGPIDPSDGEPLGSDISWRRFIAEGLARKNGIDPINIPQNFDTSKLLWNVRKNVGGATNAENYPVNPPANLYGDVPWSIVLENTSTETYWFLVSDTMIDSETSVMCQRRVLEDTDYMGPGPVGMYPRTNCADTRDVVTPLSDGSQRIINVEPNQKVVLQYSDPIDGIETDKNVVKAELIGMGNDFDPQVVNNPKNPIVIYDTKTAEATVSYNQDSLLDISMGYAPFDRRLELSYIINQYDTPKTLTFSSSLLDKLGLKYSCGAPSETTLVGADRDDNLGTDSFCQAIIPAEVDLSQYADADGMVGNKVTVTADDGSTVTETQWISTLPAESNPGLTAAKTFVVNDVNKNGKNDGGDTITWTITTRNILNYEIRNVRLEDPNMPETAECTGGRPVRLSGAIGHPMTAVILEPGKTRSCTYTTVVPKNQCTVENTMTATGGNSGVGSAAPNLRSIAPIFREEEAPTPYKATASATVPLACDSDVDITKYINGDDANLAPGVLVDKDAKVTFVVKNVGTNDLKDVLVTDDVLKNVTCPKTTLDQGEEMTCNATLPALAEEEQHKNIGTVTAVDVMSGDTVTDADPAFAHGPAKPVNTITGKLYYDYNGNSTMDEKDVPWTGVTVTLIDKTTGNVVKTVTNNPDGSYEFTPLYNGDYEVKVTGPNGWTFTQDWTEKISDTVKPDGNSPTIVLNNNDQHDVDFGIVAPASIDLTKTVDKPVAQVGETLTYTITTKNTGGVDLTPKFTDNQCVNWKLDSGDVNSDGLLNVDETWVNSCTHVATLADALASPYVNTASVVGTPVIPIPDVTDTDKASTIFPSRTPDDKPVPPVFESGI